MFRAASPSQAMSEDSKSYSECSIWIWTVKCNAHGFSQYYNFQNQKITMLENMGYVTELTAWHCYQGHMSSTPVWRGGNRSHFFRLTYSTKFQKVNTPLTSQFRGSIPRTGQTGRGWISVLVRQRRVNRASLWALTVVVSSSSSFVFLLTGVSGCTWHRDAFLVRLSLGNEVLLTDRLNMTTKQFFKKARNTVLKQSRVVTKLGVLTMYRLA